MLTSANALTFLRLVLAPALFAAILSGSGGVAVAVFALAVATDVADGRLARRAGTASSAGGLFDHGVDAVFVTLGTAALASVGVLPLALPLFIAAAFTQYAFDSSVLTSGGARPFPLGRWNGIAYYVIVAVPIVRNTMGLSWPSPAGVEAMGWALVVTTAVSMGDRVRLLLRVRAGAVSSSE
jgi:phosphatidylglycerophosphate synthase